jgi:hypothetical protein
LGRPRSVFAGGTDYTAVPLSDILEHLQGWSEALAADITWLGGYRRRLAAFGPNHDTSDGLAYTDYFIDLFTRYRQDIDRLRVELPIGVYSRHIELVDQLYRGAREAEDRCVDFKRHHQLDGLSPNDKLQHTLAEAYRHTRGAVVDLFDLSNMIPRLQTFLVHTEPERHVLDALELKPNLFGIGLNINHLLKQFLRRLRPRRFKM